MSDYDYEMAGVRGIEPLLSVLETVVLPLYDTPMFIIYTCTCIRVCAGARAGAYARLLLRMPSPYKKKTRKKVR